MSWAFSPLAPAAALLPGTDPAINIHPSTPAQAVTSGEATSLTATTASFTAPTDAILIASVVAMDYAGTASMSWTISDSGGLSWTLINDRDYPDASIPGAVAHYWAKTTSAVARTVSAQATASAGNVADVILDLRVFTGADLSDPVGAVGEGSSSTNNITPSAFTSEQNDSFLVAVAGDWNNLGLPTSSDLTARAFSGGIGTAALSGYKSIPTAGAQTFNFDAAGSSSPLTNWCAFELKPAVAARAPPPVFVLQSFMHMMVR